MKRRTFLRLFATLISALLVLTALCPAAMAEEDAGYVFCIRDEDGQIVAAMDTDAMIQVDPAWLRLDPWPADKALDCLITSLRRDGQFSLIGKLSFIPWDYVPIYVGEHRGFFLDTQLGFLPIALGENVQAVIIPEEWHAEEQDYTVLIPQAYIALGAGITLMDQLNADMPAAYQVNVQDDPYTYNDGENILYSVMYAYLGGEPLWIGDNNCEPVDQETFVRWFLAQSTMRRYTLSYEEDEALELDGIVPLQDNHVTIFCLPEEYCCKIVVKTPEKTCCLTLMSFLDDPFEEGLVLEGYIYALLRLNGFSPEDYGISGAVSTSGSYMVYENTHTAEAVQDRIDDWLNFGERNMRQAMGESVE